MKRYVIAFVLACIAVVCGLWAFFYYSYSTAGLPLGWDTPYYVWRIHSAATSSIATFLANERYYDFFYALLGGWIQLAGVPGFLGEIIRPVLLWIICVLVIVVIVRREMPDVRAPFIAAAAGSTWFALFRLSADPHSNLLALTIMLCGTWVFLRAQNEALPRRFAFMLVGLAGTVLLASITHVETAIFLSATWVLTLIFVLLRRSVRFPRFLALLTTVTLSLLPGIVIYYFQLQWLATGLQGRLPAITTLDFGTWLLYLGPIGLGVLIAAPVAYYFKLFKISSPIITFTFAWLTLSLTIGFAQYLNPSFTPLSERAVILIPTPFLASVIIPRLTAFKISKQLTGIGLISLVILGVGTGYLVSEGHHFYNSFISDSEASSLQYLQSSGILNLKSTIFIFSDPSDAPGSANHSSFWVGAYLGDHYSYLGRLDFLMAAKQTPFTADQAQQISTQFWQGLPLNQVNNMTIVYIPDFNYPNPPPRFYAPLLHPIGENVYEINRTAWDPGLVMIPSSGILSSTGPWYTVTHPWDQSGSSLELNTTRANSVATVSFAFVAPRDGNFTVSLRMIDEVPSNPISIFMDGTYVHQINYTGTSTPENVTVFTSSLTKGTHILTLSVDDQPTMSQLVSLDYVSIRET